MYRSFFQHRSKGFTLIEISIVLIIIGILAGAVLKGRELIETAKIQSVLSDLNRYKTAISLYQETYHALPGDDPRASDAFGPNVSNGDGDGIIQGNDILLFWVHLQKAGHVPSDKEPSSKLGGIYQPIYSPTGEISGHWIRLGKKEGSNANGGLLAPKQAQILKSKGDDTGETHDPLKGSIRFSEGQGIEKGKCVKDNRLNLTIQEPVCVAYLAF